MHLYAAFTNLKFELIIARSFGISLLSTSINRSGTLIEILVTTTESEEYLISGSNAE